MLRPPRRPGFSKHALSCLRAFFLATLVATTGCDSEEPPAWPGPTVPEEIEARRADPPAAAPEAPALATSRPFRFVVYNVRNWLTMERSDSNRQPLGAIAKPEAERDAAVAIVADLQPDLVGLCEIGTLEDLADLQQRLAARGIDLPHRHHDGGADPVRRLALLSRFPITDTVRHPPLRYELLGRPFEMSRGILDATVATPAGPVRFLGAHLKSKREVPEGDQARMRLEEARLLRTAATRALRADPPLPLVVYGDFNDSRQSPVLRLLRGPGDAPETLYLTKLADSRGEFWTHHWTTQDIYSRFDYVLVSEPLLDLIDWENSRVVDDPRWAVASDHRPLLIQFGR